MIKRKKGLREKRHEWESSVAGRRDRDLVMEKLVGEEQERMGSLLCQGGRDDLEGE